jgi:PAS domain S-box-containing protein
MKNPEQTERRTGYAYLLIFILLAAGILTGGYFAYRHYEKNYRAEVEHQLSAVAELKVDQLVQWRKERLGDANVFYKNDAFSDLIRRYFKNPTDADAKRRIQVWMGQHSMVKTYNRICFHDVTGTERISFPEEKIHTPLIFSVRSAEVLKSGKVEFQDFYRDENDKKVYLTIFVPILDEYDKGKMLGILALRIDPTQYLYPMIEKWPMPSRTSETLILRRDGNDAFFLNELRFQKNSALNLRIPLSETNRLGVKAVLGQEGIIEGVDYRGVPVIGEVRAVPDSPWFLVARMDMEEVYSSLRERLWLMAVLVGALLVGAGASIGLVWHQQRTRFNLEQYKSVEALRDLEGIIDTVREPLIALDQELRVVKVSRSFYEFFKVKPEETVGLLIYDLGNKQWDIPKLRELLETILPQKASFDNYEVEHDFVTIGRRTMLLNARQIERGLGKERIILLAIEDITERKEIEAGLEKTRKELVVIKQSADEASEFSENIINTVREPLLSLDQDLRVVAVSRSFYEFFKVKPEETVGQLIYDLGNKQWDIPKLRELLETILPQKASFDNYEVEHDFTTIGRRTMLLNARQIQRASGKERIILLAIEDITERKEIEAGLEKTRKELEVANKELEAFSYSVSHDLRAPLRHISGYVELLTTRFQSALSEKGQHYLGSIADSVRQMGKLIDDLLQFSRTGRADMRRSDSDMNVIVQEVVESVGKDNPDRTIEWTISKLPSVFCDATRVGESPE